MDAREEITADYTNMIYAATPEGIETRRKAFIRKWRLKHHAVRGRQRKIDLLIHRRSPSNGDTVWSWFDRRTDRQLDVTRS